MKAVLINNEAARLEALRQYKILDTAPEGAFDELASIAAQICRTPIALINLIDAERQWFKSKVGLDLAEVPRNIGLCSLCIEQQDVIIVTDTLADERSRANPVVTSYPYVRFYAGVPLITPEGHAIGTLCVADHVPRELSSQQVEALRALSRQIVSQLELRHNLAVLACTTTKYKQLEAQLRRREQDQEPALLDIATDAIIVRDLENKILFWNKSAEHLYGWNAEAALGKNADQLLYSNQQPKLKEVHKTVVDRGSWQGELSKVQKSGKEIIVLSRWILVRDEQGLPKSILSVDTDITEKKQLEAQFLRAQRLKSIGTLASGIAHDLNNVLAPILMSAQLLQMKTSDARSLQLLQTMESNAKRGAALVKQVLEFARGNVEAKCTIVQVRHLISEIKQIATQTFPKSIEFSTDIAPDLWTVYADATQLHQVLMNLVVNARDAMASGGTLSICAENQFIDENYARMNLDATVGPYIVITVADTGTGIPPEIVERIFEPFFTTKELGRGTGLGLSTVVGIIKSHGGFLNLYSKVGKGTQFKVYLPAVEATE